MLAQRTEIYGTFLINMQISYMQTEVQYGRITLHFYICTKFLVDVPSKLL